MVAAALVLALVAVRCIEGDELHCENAVTRLDECCGELQVDAAYCEHTEGCGVVYPTIDEDDAECIAEASCAELVQGGVCERARAAPHPTDSRPGPDLCP